MSWYIQYLLRHREEIRSDIYSEQKAVQFQASPSYDLDNWEDGDGDDDWGDSYLFITVPNFESDHFNDLLLLEKKLVEMYKSGIINLDDVRLIEMVGTNETFTNLEKELGMRGDRIQVAFTNLCNLLSYKMGNVFSDDNICDRFKEDYNLTDEQVGKLKQYMKATPKERLKQLRRKN